MANISIRKLDEKIYRQLKIRAFQHGISMEEEARQIISQAIETPKRITDIFRKHFGTKYGIDLNLEEHRQPHKPINFKE